MRNRDNVLRVIKDDISYKKFYNPTNKKKFTEVLFPSNDKELLDKLRALTGIGIDGQDETQAIALYTSDPSTYADKLSNIIKTYKFYDDMFGNELKELKNYRGFIKAENNNYLYSKDNINHEVLAKIFGGFLVADYIEKKSNSCCSEWWQKKQTVK